MSQIVIIPYFSEQEVDRYLKLARRLQAFAAQSCEYQFLLASSPTTRPSQRLQSIFSAIAPVTTLRCSTRFVGYPIGATAMFWDCMDHIGENFERDGGFSLWLESDMVPVKPDWLDRLSAEWHAAEQPLRVMGCLVPAIRRPLLPTRRLLVTEHINGGACYAKNIADLPLDARSSSLFDSGLYAAACRAGGVKATRQIAFSTTERARRDSSDPELSLLHGYMQDKDAFIARCLAADPGDSSTRASRHRIVETLSNSYRKLRLHLPMSRNRLVIESLLLARDRRAKRPRRAA